MAIALKAITTRLGYQQITSLSGATNLTPPATATFAVINVEGTAGTAFVRWRDDAAPTASVGMPLAAGVTLQYDGDLTKIQFIEQTAGAKLNISYYA